MTGTCRKAADMDLAIRMMSMQKPHQALAITGAICTTAAAFLPDTVLSELIDIKREVLRLAHPGGIIETKAEFVAGHISAIKVVRTARMILEGYVYTKSHYTLASQSQLA
ncbi:PrpF domain-containing protein [Brevibacillus agri]|uniref:PrpF domain-containing protein n=1 Tax=Brevibacillus agri TaxID=51101 RepID=UPI002E246A90|nr:PrpF domain-containing protein [Brevibacillus agri]